MINKNICKYIASSLPYTLTANYFVRETKAEHMSHPLSHSEHLAILFTEGKGQININDNTLSYHSGMLVFIYKDDSFFCTPQGETEYFYIGFEGSRSDELFHRFGICRGNQVFRGFDGLIPMWRESLTRATEKTIDLAAESVLLYTFSRMDASEDDKKMGAVRKVIDILEEDFTDPDLSITTIAQRLSYNHKYLSHIFKQKTGSSYSDYLRSLRIKHAVLLFNHGIESVKNVAILCGFSDPLYFSTVFKKQTGLSPSEYKAKLNDGQK
ncbi:MAG: helix-turn-helix transcriptional regulator [Clostridia bacterium]|nr:helix-turn-helix transcriptional regulator [Clostridia bacterium]